MTSDTPILVEGGAVHQRISRTLALLIGAVIGLTGGLGFDTILALKTSSEIADSRRNAVLLSCREVNDRHNTAKAGMERLVARTQPKPPTKAQAKRNKHTLDEFVDALAPSYVAGKGSLKAREREGCERRLRELTRP